MNVQLNNVSDTRKSLVVTLDQGEVDAVHLSVVTEFAKLARLPGFRPGKAPTALVAKRFAKDIAEDFKQKVVGKAYRDALAQQKFEVVNVIAVKEGELKPGRAAEITITLDVRPEFILPEYKGLVTEITAVAVTDAEVDAVIERMRAERAEFKVAERAAAKGDYVKLAYEGSIDGKPVAELVPDKQLYGAVPQTWEEVEGEQEGVIPGLGKQLAGLKAGDKKSVPVQFPAEFPAAPALAGQAAVYGVTVQEVRERALPPIDEAFLKANRADTLDALKAGVRNNLKLQKEHQNRIAQRRQVTEKISEKIEVAAPDSLVERETQSVLRQFIEENMRRGVPQEEFEKEKKVLFENARAAATRRVKAQIVLAKIAEAEKLEVSESDIDTFIYHEAMRTQQKPDKLAKALASDREQLRAVQQSIIFDKAVDFLVTHATVTTVQPKG